MSRLPKTISVEKLDNSVLFTFAQNQHYLYDGTIEVPFNSLSIIADKSEAITLRKSASNDIFISAPWENFDITASSKEDVVDALVEMLYDEAGISQEEVQDMIDAATSGIPSSQVIEQLRTDVNTISGDVANKQDRLVAGDNITISGNVISAEAGNNIIELTQAEYDALTEKDPDALYIITDASEINMNDYWTSAETKSYVDGKVDDALDDYWTSAETQNAINAATSGIPSSQVIEALRTDVNTISGDVQSLQDDVNSVWDTIDEKEEVVASALTQLNLRLNEDEEVTAAALNDLNDRIGSGGGALFVDFDDLMNNMNDDKWDELVDAIQNKKPIFDGYNGSEGDVTDARLTPVDGYVYINETEGSAEIGLKQLYGGGYRDLYIVKNGSEDYEVTDNSFDYQPMLQAGSGISIDENNVISVTVDSELDETSNNPVANSAVTTVIIDDEEVISRAINELNDRLVAVESGGSSVTVDTSLDSGSTNPVANSAITNAINAKAEPYSAGTGIEISGNVISATGGGGSYVYYTEDTSSESATIKVENDDGLGNRSENRVSVEGGDIIIETYKETDDGEGNTGTTDTQVDINSLRLSIIAYSDDGIDTTQTELKVQPMGAYINSEPIATEPYVDTALSGKADTSAVTTAIDAAISGKADTSAVTAAIDDAKAYYISFATLATVGIHDEDWDGIVAAIDDHRPIYAGYPRTDGGIIYYGVECMNKNSGNTEIVMTASDNSAHYFYTFTKNGSNNYSYTVSTKPYVPDITTSITSGSTDSEIPTAKAVYDATQSGGGGVTVDPTLDSGSTNPVANSAITNAINAKAEKTGCLGLVLISNNTPNREFKSSLIQYNAVGSGGATKGYFGGINGKAIAVQYSNQAKDFQLVEKSAITSAITSASTNDEVAGAKAVYDALDAKADASTTYTKTEVNNLVNNKFWCGTQAQYDAIATKENDVLYLIHE